MGFGAMCSLLHKDNLVAGKRILMSMANHVQGVTHSRGYREDTWSELTWAAAWAISSCMIYFPLACFHFPLLRKTGPRKTDKLSLANNRYAGKKTCGHVGSGIEKSKATFDKIQKPHYRYNVTHPACNKMCLFGLYPDPILLWMREQ